MRMDINVNHYVYSEFYSPQNFPRELLFVIESVAETE